MSELFLSASTTWKYLDTNQRNLRHVSDYLPHLQAPSHTRFYLAGYVRALAQHLLVTDDKFTTPSSKAFAQEASTRQLLADAKKRVDNALRAKWEFNTTEVARLLGTDRSVVTKWCQEGHLLARREQVVPKKDRGKTPQERIMIPSSNLRKALVWHLPQV